jgi:hypothetical protein
LRARLTWFSFVVVWCVIAIAVLVGWTASEGTRLNTNKPEFPASFSTGPLGSHNLLPPKTIGALLGIWPYDATTLKRTIRSREAALGRKVDIVHLHWAAPDGGCDYGAGAAPFTTGRESWVVNHGSILMMSWAHGWTIDEVNQGKADACLTAFGKRAAAFRHRFLLRIYWEFNGPWTHWSSKGPAFIEAWKRTVTKIREAGGTNVGFVWSPAGSYQSEAVMSYPGDEWVDWIGVSAYNFNVFGAYCSAFNPGPWCPLREVLSSVPTDNNPRIYDIYASRKPFVVAEWGSVEDPNVSGRKGRWFLNARAKIKTELPEIRAMTYYDIDVTRFEGNNFRLDTSASSLRAFCRLASDPFFNTRSTRSAPTPHRPPRALPHC